MKSSGASRVLNIFGKLDRGGAELRTISVLPYASSENIRVDFCVLSGERGDLDAEVEASGGEVYPLVFDWKLPFRLVRLFQVLQCA